MSTRRGALSIAKQGSLAVRQRARKPQALDDGLCGREGLGVDRLGAVNRNRLRREHAEDAHVCSCCDSPLPLERAPLKSTLHRLASRRGKGAAGRVPQTNARDRCAARGRPQRRTAEGRCRGQLQEAAAEEKSEECSARPVPGACSHEPHPRSLRPRVPYRDSTHTPHTRLSLCASSWTSSCSGGTSFLQQSPCYSWDLLRRQGSTMFQLLRQTVAALEGFQVGVQRLHNRTGGRQDVVCRRRARQG
jgi:hypothetical protein